VRVLFDALALGVRPSGTRARLLGLVPALLARRVHVGIIHGPGLSDDERRRLGGAELIEVPAPRGDRSRDGRGRHEYCGGHASRSGPIM